MIYGKSETLFEEFVAENGFTQEQIQKDQGDIIARQYTEWLEDEVLTARGANETKA